MNKEKGHQGGDEHKNEREVCLVIHSSLGKWQANFDKTTKVAEVITATINHFGFDRGGKYALVIKSTSETLKPERTLVSYGFSEVCQDVNFTDKGNAAYGKQ